MCWQSPQKFLGNLILLFPVAQSYFRRSIAFLVLTVRYLFVAPPFYFLRFLAKVAGPGWLDSSVLFTTVRATFTLYSLVIDCTLYYSTQTYPRYCRGVLLLWATSYLHVAYFSHAFSNCVEAVLLALAFRLAFFIYWSPRNQTKKYIPRFRQALVS